MPSEFAPHWSLDPTVTFLNHGSYGATPTVVLEAQRRWRDQMEAEPVRFFSFEFEPALAKAREVLADFVGANADDLAFVPNATAGFNTVLRSLELRPGDELVTTDHAYNAARNALEFNAERAGARVVIATVPFPIDDEGAAADSIMAAITSRTRLVLLDHITSATSLILPIRSLVAELTARGIEMLVDGAHAPGQVRVDLADLGATYYTANLHKWVCAPKSSGFLWVRPDRQAFIRPLAISHGANSPRTDQSRFRSEFDWTGTADPSAYLAVPDAIAFGELLVPGGWDGLRRRNHDLVLAGRDLVCAALDIPGPVPDSMIGCMASIPLPFEGSPGRVQGVELYDDAVHDHLVRRGIQVMTTPWPQRPGAGPWRRLVRISAAAYNDIDQYAALAAHLPDAIAASAAA